MNECIYRAYLGVAFQCNQRKDTLKLLPRISLAQAMSAGN